MEPSSDIQSVILDDTSDRGKSAERMQDYETLTVPQEQGETNPVSHNSPGQTDGNNTYIAEKRELGARPKKTTLNNNQNISLSPSGCRMALAPSKHQIAQCSRVIHIREPRGPDGGRGFNHRRNVTDGNMSRSLSNKSQSTMKSSYKDASKPGDKCTKRLKKFAESNMDEEKLCFSLISETFGFFKLLEQDHISVELMELVLALIAKACSSPVREHVLPLLSRIAQSRFLEHHVSVQFLMRRFNENDRDQQMAFVETIDHILQILEEILDRLPSFSYKTEAVLIILDPVVARLKQLCDTDKDALQCQIKAMKVRANEIQTRNIKAQERKERGGSRRQKASTAIETGPPPSNFRYLEISPMDDDIHMVRKPYVRANKDLGGYDDLDHYLDVQFRLLKEDYIRSLRDGIAEYLQNAKADEDNMKLSDVNLYRGVHIICPVCTINGIAYRIKIDMTELQYINWQFSKRLIYGSLLCLTSDNFQTFTFATVTDRQTDEISKGYLCVRFVDNAFSEDNIHQQFIMIETSAYYEAYKHVLEALQEITEDMPFQRYIVSCQNDVMPPRYLRRPDSLPYDLSFFVRKGVSLSEKSRTEHVPVLTPLKWPTTDTISFDESQLRAVKTALTKEFAIIQGPPGTGKTYVGLKIVEALLVNKSAWGSHKPILVVCYTNHALDQFLEGMLDLGINEILRVGGRSSSTRLECFTLKKIKEEMRKEKKRRWDVCNCITEYRSEMSGPQSVIDRTSIKLDLSTRGILHASVLKQYMTLDQVNSFDINRASSGQRGKTIIPLWLHAAASEYSEAEQFGESHMYALALDHIVDLLLNISHRNSEDDHTFSLEKSLHELENNLELLDKSQAETEIEENILPLKIPKSQRWDLYIRLYKRIKREQFFRLKRAEKRRQIAAEAVVQFLSVNPQSSNSPGYDNIQQKLMKARKVETEIRKSWILLTQRPGILKTSVLSEVMTSSEKIMFEFGDGIIDELFFVTWLGYGDVVHIFDKEMKAEQHATVMTKTERHELTEEDEGDEAESITQQRIIDDYDEGVAKSKAQERAELEKWIASSELSVYLDENRVHKDWQVKMPSKRKQMHRVKQILLGKDFMDQEEAESVRDVWQLNLADRCRLYAYWLRLYREDTMRLIETHIQWYDDIAHDLKTIRDREDYYIMQEASVIGMTTTGAARLRHALHRLEPPIIVVEEAAEVLESHIITALNPACQHLILIGDHKQLRPSPAVYELAKYYNLELSLFERMVNNTMRCDTLELQHRMRPEISELMRFIYPTLKNHPTVLDLEHVKGVSTDLFFIDHQFPEVRHEENKSRSNPHEACFLAAFCHYLLLQGYSPSQISVLTTYAGQVFQLRKVLPKSSYGGIRITTVDDYQGEENDIVLLSLVRSNAEGSIGFLNIENRVCVTLSRARNGLYVIGNFSLLSSVSTLWSKMTNMLRKKGLFGPELELYCQNHPNLERIKASTAEDFAGAPDGGCSRRCESRLDCGHQCAMSCHILDPNHQEYQCRRRCERKCPSGHKCGKLCYETCKCNVMVKKMIPKCGHRQNVPCHQDSASFICQADCVFSLACGHTCVTKCGKKDSVVCREEVRLTWPCGHLVNTVCSSNPRDFPCPEPCGTTLHCGHPCVGSCGTCFIRTATKHCGCEECDLREISYED